LSDWSKILIKAKKDQRTSPKELPSAYFARTRPKFYDWMAPTPDELLLEAEKRRESRDAELRKVTELEKAKQASRKSEKKKPPGR